MIAAARLVEIAAVVLPEPLITSGLTVRVESEIVILTVLEPVNVPVTSTASDR